MPEGPTPKETHVTPPNMNWPRQPRPPYRIPTIKETTRLAGQWKALSGKVKIGVVAGGVLSLGAVGAMANPLTSTPSPQVPKFASASVTSLARPTSAAVTTKATTTQPATTAPATPASVSVPATTAAPATTAPAAPTTKAATTAKATTAAPKTTAATKATTTAAVNHRHGGRILLGRRRDRSHEYGQGHGLQDDGDRLPAALARGLAVHSMAITAHP